MIESGFGFAEDGSWAHTIGPLACTAIGCAPDASESIELDGCRVAIDKFTALLPIRGRIELALGFDSAVHAMSESLQMSRRRLGKWQDSLVRLTIASQRRAFVLAPNAVEPAQWNGGTSPVANFVSVLHEGACHVKGLDSAPSSVLGHLSLLRAEATQWFARSVFRPRNRTRNRRNADRIFG